MGEYYVINGYRKKVFIENGKKRIAIELLEKGKVFTTTLLEEGISKERVNKIENYLETIFNDLDKLGCGGAALLTILYYIHSC